MVGGIPHLPSLKGLSYRIQQKRAVKRRASRLAYQMAEPTPLGDRPEASRLSQRERSVVQKLFDVRQVRELNALEVSILETMVEGDEAGDIKLPARRPSVSLKNEGSLPRSLLSSGNWLPAHQDTSQASLGSVPRISVSHVAGPPSSRGSFESAASRVSQHPRSSSSCGPLASTLHDPANHPSQCGSFVSALSNLSYEGPSVTVMTPVNESTGDLLEIEGETVVSGEVRITTPEYRVSSDAASCRATVDSSMCERSKEGAQTPDTTPEAETVRPRSYSLSNRSILYHPIRHQHCRSLRIPQTSHEIKVAKVYHSLSLHSGRSRPNPFFDEDPTSSTYIVPRPTSVPCHRLSRGPLSDLFDEYESDQDDASSSNIHPRCAKPSAVMRMLSGQSAAPSSVYSEDNDGRLVLGKAREWPPRSSSLGAVMMLKEEGNGSRLTVTIALDDELAREMNLEERMDQQKKTSRRREANGRGQRASSMGKEFTAKVTSGLRGVKKVAKRSSQILRRR